MATTTPVAPDATATGRQRLVLVAMILAVSTTFIDQTIVSIAVPQIQNELGLTASGAQWIVNAYLLALAATFAFGGRLADIFGHRRMVVTGIVVFAAASALNGAVPSGEFAEAWLITFRAVQGFGAALMLPAALAIVVSSYGVHERGRALAKFFGITGAMTAVGPIAGGYLTEWTWRSIFWINLPIAAAALVLIHFAHPEDTRKEARVDVPGLILVAAGMALSVLGLQEAARWGWTSPLTIGCLAGGTLLLVAFVALELRTKEPLIQMRIFANQAFAVENAVLFLCMIAFVPLFFFASMYSQIALGDSASEAGTYVLTFFIGFAVAAQIAGRNMDKEGAKRSVVTGCILGAVGFWLWAGELTDLSSNAQFWYMVMAGAGVGFMLGPASTDALNRAKRGSYGEVSGITQTVRNYGASLGLAVLGTVLLTQTKTHVGHRLMKAGVPNSTAHTIATDVGSAVGSGGHRASAAVTHAIQTGYAEAMQYVFKGMAIAMAAGAVVAILGLRDGVQDDLDETVAAA